VMTIHDSAWSFEPAVNKYHPEKSSRNFASVVAHELTHLAQFESPSLLDDFETTLGYHWHSSLIWGSPVGDAYPNPSKAEDMAMTVAAYMYQPGAFNHLFWRDWRFEWVSEHAWTYQYWGPPPSYCTIDTAPIQTP
jgi:hypothetical protein